MSDLILEKLKEFEPITLEEMDSVKLMDRLDTKFVFHVSKFPQILDEMKANYRILEINGVRASRYETLYYDTEDLSLYHRHQAGKLNRYKVRSRKYVESNLHFFEVKFKSNKGRTIKERIKLKEIEDIIDGKSAEFLSSHSPLRPADLKPAVWVYYSRVTMVNRHSPERLTLDIGLRFRYADKEYSFADMVIAEVKQSRSAGSPFIRIMRKNYLRPGSISKYCLGIIHTHEQVKVNNFKPRLRTIKKVLYGKTA